MRSLPSSPRRGVAGFTLVELLAVMVVLGLLTFFLLPRLMGAGETVRIESTRAYLATLEAMVREHELDAGDYPASTFPKSLDPKPSPSNMGAEMLVISMWPKDGNRAGEVEEDRLCNSDGDDTRSSHTMFTSSQAFELADDWGNPIAYFHRRDYREPCLYLTFDETGEVVESRVQAAVSPLTQDPYNKASFQLISAGPDGIFGTEDDIGNFTVQEGSGG